MKVGNYTVKWTYDTDFIVQHVGGKAVDKERDITICEIIDNDAQGGEDPIVTRESIARLWEDPYCKETARKVSMDKALTFSTFTKKERSQFWEVYRTQTKNPRWTCKQ